VAVFGLAWTAPQMPFSTFNGRCGWYLSGTNVCGNCSARHRQGGVQVFLRDAHWSSPLETRTHLGAALAAGGADEIWLDVGQPHVIGPAVGVDRDVLAASVVAAIDQ
jgi:hypothetical protein